MSDDKARHKPLTKHLSSEDLAGLIVDALADAGFVNKRDLAAAVNTAAAEIEARKALGDY